MLMMMPTQAQADQSMTEPLAATSSASMTSRTSSRVSAWMNETPIVARMAQKADLAGL